MVIVAKRGAQKQTFTEKQWKEMPPDKYGWLPVTDEPEEVTTMKAQKELHVKMLNEISVDTLKGFINLSTREQLEHMLSDETTPDKVKTLISDRLITMPAKEAEPAPESLGNTEQSIGNKEEIKAEDTTTKTDAGPAANTTAAPDATKTKDKTGDKKNTGTKK